MCTNLTLGFKESGHYLSARTLDFSFIIQTTPSFLSTEKLPSIADDGEESYGFVAANYEDTQFCYEGMNTEGLSAALLWLPETQFPTQSDYPCKQKPVEITDLVAYILRRYKVVEKLYYDLSDKGELYITFTMDKLSMKIRKFIENTKKDTLPVHLVVTDAEGESLVVECIGGKMKLYYKSESENDLEDSYVCSGVLTNSPPYDFHLNNLAFYERLNCVNNPININGSGLFGLPGDATSPSRFLRASKMKGADLDPGNEADGEEYREQNQTVQALHLIQQCEVPIGSVIELDSMRKSESDSNHTWVPGDFTQWTVVRDHANQMLYTTSYKNPTLYKIDVKKVCSSGRNDIQDTEWYKAFKGQISPYDELEPVTQSASIVAV